MKQEDKELLLRYLSMALPYGVKVQEFEVKYGYKLLGVNGDWLHIDCPVYDEGDGYVEVDYCKPYLRPMSNMTKEEDKEYGLLCFDVSYYDKDTPKCSFKLIKWLLEKHFDFMGLTPKGLAIEVTEENNPYNITEE